jgi:hypothetical protein
MEKEPRKIVLILGNGFDLDLGLNTSYKDFWASDDCPKDYPAPIIQHLNQKWPNGLDAVKWYDLENELLNYYTDIHHSRRIPDVITSDEKEFIKNTDPARLSFGVDPKYIDAANSLLKKGYLIDNPTLFPRYQMPYRDDLMQTSIWRDKKALRYIKEGLCRYINKLNVPKKENQTIAFQVLSLLDKAAQSGDFVSVYSFNYTRVQLNGQTPDAVIVHYMHGSCDDGAIIIGTRDDKDISANYDFLQKSFDPAFNPPALVGDLKDADEVVIFGHSIGENDRQYFKAFFMQQTDYSHIRRKDITIFTRDFASEIQIKRALQKMTDWNLSSLYGLNNLQIIKTGNLKADQRKLYDFLVKYGKGEYPTREFISNLLQN